MSRLVEHMEREIRLAGITDADADYDGLIASSVAELVKVFAVQGHSGGSAVMTLNLFDRLVNFMPLTTLKDTPDEWTDMSAYDGSPAGTLFQNVRCSSVFKRHGKAFDVGMKTLYIRPDGSSFTMSDELAPEVTFPYAPGLPTMVRVDEDGMVV